MNLELEVEQKVASQKLAKMVYGVFCIEQSEHFVYAPSTIARGADDIETLVEVLKALPERAIALPNRDIAEIITLEYNEELLQEFGLALRKVILEFPASDSYEIADHNLRTWFCNCESLENELRTV